ncbi:E-selectin-like isoform X2 [Sesbania bispinosa]|nr:E-selectin-like isoform X2 [Sesbania bispinosa]
MMQQDNSTNLNGKQSRKSCDRGNGIQGYESDNDDGDHHVICADGLIESGSVNHASQFVCDAEVDKGLCIDGFDNGLAGNHASRCECDVGGLTVGQGIACGALLSGSAHQFRETDNGLQRSECDVGGLSVGQGSACKALLAGSTYQYRMIGNGLQQAHDLGQRSPCEALGDGEINGLANQNCMLGEGLQEMHTVESRKADILVQQIQTHSDVLGPNLKDVENHFIGCKFGAVSTIQIDSNDGSMLNNKDVEFPSDFLDTRNRESEMVDVAGGSPKDNVSSSSLEGEPS